MRTIEKVFVGLLIACGYIVSSGCDDVGTGTPGPGVATLSVLLTDAPGDVVSAVVTITDIYLVGAEDDTAAEDDDPAASGRVYLRQDNPVTTDLLTLSNDVISLVDGVALPSGSYSQLRFVISGAYLEVEGPGEGTTIYATSADYDGLPVGATVDGDLMCPSCSSSGFKVKLDSFAASTVELSDGSDETLLVDFDVSQSFGKQAGNSGKWVMSPVLKAVSNDDSAEIAVSLDAADGLEFPVVDEVATSLADFSASLTPAAGGDPTVIALADADGDGTFEASFRHVLPGDYDVSIVGPETLEFTTDPASPVVATAAEAGEVEVEFTLTAVSEASASTE